MSSNRWMNDKIIFLWVQKQSFALQTYPTISGLSHTHFAFPPTHTIRQLCTSNQCNSKFLCLWTLLLPTPTQIEHYSITNTLAIDIPGESGLRCVCVFVSVCAYSAWSLYRLWSMCWPLRNARTQLPLIINYNNNYRIISTSVKDLVSLVLVLRLSAHNVWSIDRLANVCWSFFSSSLFAKDEDD